MKALRAIAHAATLLFALAMLSSGAALAANKTFSLTAQPTTGTPAAFKFTFTATSNSTFNALTLSLPAGYSLLPNATVTPSRGTASFITGGIKVESINVPVGSPNESVTVTLTGITAGGTCGSGTNGTWSAQPWTGSTVGNGNKFSIDGSFPTTSVAPTCFTITASTGAGGAVSPAGTTSVPSGGSQAYAITPNAGNPAYHITGVNVDGAPQGAITSYTFTNVLANHTIDASFAANALSIASAPSTVTAGTSFNVTVGITPGAPLTFNNSSTCGADFGTGPTFSAGNTTATFAITIPKAAQGGSCSITFAAPGYGSIPLNNLNVVGILGCGDYWSGPTNANDPSMNPDNDTAFVGTPTIGGLWGLLRGQNTDGAPCVPVNFTFLVNPNNTASFLYDKVSDPTQAHAAFKYVILWNAVPVDLNGPTQGFGGHRPLVSWGTPDPSTDDYVPALMCTDDGSATGGFNSLSPTDLLALLPTIPNDAPSGPFYTASQNGRTQYTPGLKAKICVAQQGQTSVGVDGSGNVLIQYWDKFIDESDSFIKMP